ncbi:Imm49 family immunity protein [Pedobacter montanisoli]|uniref:Immunity 49 family protein n=1 Tax=Pedobacter montanisoli TaxID=2923277 RepID=A0ABS9ZYD7_9SPHI|nr:Imm49 family immunity protein [Pedobacter montanisoli]MCJ0743320.1 immunity 49 family protein [Pedobacter montanisoli]
MERFEHLKTIYDERLDDEQIVEQKLKTGGDPNFNLIIMGGTYIVFAVHAIYSLKDLDLARNYFYKAARIDEYRGVNLKRCILDTGINPISYALLSDNHDLIQRFCKLQNSKCHELSVGFQISHAVLNILSNEMEKLEENIQKIERFVKVRTLKWWAPMVDVFLGFLSKEEGLIEAGLKQLIKTDSKRNDDPLISRFFSPDVSGLCKLAWIKGYEIDLKNEMVPLELMPIKPLDHYEDYPFLK